MSESFQDAEKRRKSGVRHRGAEAQSFLFLETTTLNL